jgi:hypothetical protein
MHAWPEVYFEGVGWVRFEPTPQDRTSAPPAYTVGEVPDESAVPTPTTTAATEQPSSAGRPTVTTEDGTTGTEDGGVPGWLPWAGGVLLLTVVAAAPRSLRTWVRRRRFSDPAPGALVEGAWAEVRATALDLGMGWHDGATLRTRARALAPVLRGGPGTGPGTDAVAALERLVLLLEQSRYSRTGLGSTGDTDVRSLADTVTEALRAAARPRVARRAEWLPSSLWRAGRPVNRRGKSVPASSASTSSEAGAVHGAGPVSELDRVSL